MTTEHYSKLTAHEWTELASRQPDLFLEKASISLSTLDAPFVRDAYMIAAKADPVTSIRMITHIANATYSLPDSPGEKHSLAADVLAYAAAERPREAIIYRPKWKELACAPAIDGIIESQRRDIVAQTIAAHAQRQENMFNQAVNGRVVSR